MFRLSEKETIFNFLVLAWWKLGIKGSHVDGSKFEVTTHIIISYKLQSNKFQE